MAADRRQGACTPTPAQHTQNANHIDLIDDSPPRAPQPPEQPHYPHLSPVHLVQSTPSIQQTVPMSHPQFAQGGFATPNANMQVPQLPDNMSQQQYEQFRQLRRQRETQAALMGGGHRGPVYNGPNHTQATNTEMGMGPGPRLVCQITTLSARILAISIHKNARKTHAVDISFRMLY